MWGWIKSAIGLALSLVTWIKGSAEKPKLTDALPYIVQHLLPAVEKAIAYGELDTKEKFDAWLATVDAGTGADVGAIDFLRDLPPEKEEQFFDHLVEAARLYGYALLKVEGFHQ